MTQSDGMIPPESPASLPDREMWRRSRAIDLADDETASFLDLAGFADGLLDADEQERVAEWLAVDPLAAADVAAAQALGGADRVGETMSEAMIARGSALVDGTGARRRQIAGNVVAFPPRRTGGPGLHEMARWGSLAAAVVFASWLGFTLGMDLSGSLSGRGGDDGMFNELLDPSPNLMRDLTESTRR